jgi:hypothetical protein
MPINRLYLAVLPIIHLKHLSTLPFQSWRFGRGSTVHAPEATEPVLTLFPDRSFATEFYPDEVEAYINIFNQVAPSLTGGHVTHYELIQQPTDDGRVVVMVEQHVS